jgi:hypothetical protein
MLALVAVIAADRLTVATASASITGMSTAVITITKHDKHQVISAAMKTASSEWVHRHDGQFKTRKFHKIKYKICKVCVSREMSISIVLYEQRIHPIQCIALVFKFRWPVTFKILPKECVRVI